MQGEKGTFLDRYKVTESDYVVWKNKGRYIEDLKEQVKFSR